MELDLRAMLQIVGAQVWPCSCGKAVFALVVIIGI